MVILNFEFACHFIITIYILYPHTHNITPIAPILSSINFCIAITIIPTHFFLLCNFCNLEIEISMMLV